MKLIDLLVKELPERGGWPDGVDNITQYRHGELCFNNEDDSCAESNTGIVIEPHEDGEAGDDTFNKWAFGLKVTREQYESALAASEGWIEWGGGECPVDGGVMIDVRYRDMKVKTLPANERIDGREATNPYWRHDNQINDIIAYRLHKPDINSRANDDRLEQDLNECIGQDVDMPEWNGDGVPPVGIECEVKWAGGKWEKCEVLFVGIEKVVVEMRNIEAAMSLCDVKFRPLRTEAENAREKLAASLHIAAGASPIELNGIGPLYFELADAIISGSVFGTTFKADK